MNKFNVGDNVGVIIAFEDDDDIIHKENIFYFNDVKIVSKSDYDDEVFILDKIKINISTKNYSGFVPKTGYELHFRNTKTNELDYASSYNCYFFVTENYLTKEDVDKFLKQIIDSKSKRIKYLVEELSKAKNELKECIEYINEWSQIISSKQKSIYTSIKDYIKSCEFYDHVEDKAYKVEDVENIDYQTLYDLCLRCDNEFNIKFDFENILMEDNDMNGICGFHTLPNGMEILGLVIGGDWEIPVNVIFYCKDGRLHNYIPKFGNCYNHETNEAYSNEDIDDPHFCFINFNYDKDKMIEEILSKF